MEATPLYPYESNTVDQEAQTKRFVWRIAAIMLLLHTFMSLALVLVFQLELTGQQWYYQVINLVLVFGLFRQKDWAYGWTLLRVALGAVIMLVQFFSTEFSGGVLLDFLLYGLIFVALIGKPNRLRAIFSASLFGLLLIASVVYVETGGINPITNPGVLKAVEAQQQLDNGNFEAAIDSFQAAIERQPDLVVAHSGLAAAYYLLGRSGEALAALDRALELEAGDSGLLGTRAVVLLDLGRYGECLRDVDLAIAQAPDVADFHDTRAICLEGVGRYDEGLAAAELAVQLAPNNAMYWVTLGWLHWDIGDFTGAKLDWEQAIDKLPADDPMIATIQSYIEALDGVVP